MSREYGNELTKNLRIRVEAPLLAAIKARADDQGKTVGEMIRSVLRPEFMGIDYRKQEGDR